MSAPAVGNGGNSNDGHANHLRSDDVFIIADTKNKEFLGEHQNVNFSDDSNTGHLKLETSKNWTETRPFENQKHLKMFTDWFSNGGTI